MKAAHLTPEERWKFMPMWKKIAFSAFLLSLPLIASIDGIIL